MMMWLLGLLGPQGIAIGLALTILTSAGGGAYAMHRWDNAAKYYEESQALKRKLRTIEKAQQDDNQRAEEASKKAERLEGVINDITTKIGSPSSVCFSDAESLQLRRLWRPR